MDRALSSSKNPAPLPPPSPREPVSTPPLAPRVPLQRSVSRGSLVSTTTTRSVAHVEASDRVLKLLRLYVTCYHARQLIKICFGCSVLVSICAFIVMLATLILHLAYWETMVTMLAFLLLPPFVCWLGVRKKNNILLGLFLLLTLIGLLVNIGLLVFGIIMLGRSTSYYKNCIQGIQAKGNDNGGPSGGMECDQEVHLHTFYKKVHKNQTWLWLSMVLYFLPSIVCSGVGVMYAYSFVSLNRRKGVDWVDSSPEGQGGAGPKSAEKHKDLARYSRGIGLDRLRVTGSAASPGVTHLRTPASLPRNHSIQKGPDMPPALRVLEGVEAGRRKEGGGEGEGKERLTASKLATMDAIERGSIQLLRNESPPLASSPSTPPPSTSTSPEKQGVSSRRVSVESLKSLRRSKEMGRRSVTAPDAGDGIFGALLRTVSVENGGQGKHLPPAGH